MDKNVENLRDWLEGKYVSPPAFRESLSQIVRDYEALLHRKTNEDYESMARGFIGKRLENFYCNGFFGRTYDLTGARIMEITREFYPDSIEVKVLKTDGRMEYGSFTDSSCNWKEVYEDLKRWTDEESEDTW